MDSNVERLIPNGVNHSKPVQPANGVYVTDIMGRLFADGGDDHDEQEYQMMQRLIEKYYGGQWIDIIMVDEKQSWPYVDIEISNVGLPCVKFENTSDMTVFIKQVNDTS